MNNPIINQSYEDFNRLELNIFEYNKFHSVSSQFTEVKSFDKEFFLEKDSNLNSYSEESKNNILFLNLFFSIPRSPKNYSIISQNFFSDSYFFYSLLNNAKNPELLLLFDEIFLNENFENLILKKLSNTDLPILKYCIKEHYLNNNEQQIQKFLFTQLFENKDNFSYLPKIYKNNDTFFINFINASLNIQEIYNLYDSNILPTNIFEQRSTEWWNENPTIFKTMVLNKIIQPKTNLNNIKKNPYYMYFILSNNIEPIPFLKKISEDDLVRILAAFKFFDQNNSHPSEEVFLSDNFVENFKNSISHFLFTQECTNQEKFQNWKDIVKNEDIRTINDKNYLPSFNFICFLQSVLKNIDKEHYDKLSIFQKNPLGNVLLTLNLVDNNKPQSFMLNDCIISCHQNLFINKFYEFYSSILQNLFLYNFKFTTDNLNLNINKKSTNFYNIDELVLNIYPLIEEKYLEYIVPINSNKNSKPIFKF